MYVGEDWPRLIRARPLTLPLLRFLLLQPKEGAPVAPALLREANKHFRVRNHPNVVNFLGLVADPSTSEPIGMLMELADGCALNVFDHSM